MLYFKKLLSLYLDFFKGTWWAGVILAVMLSLLGVLHSASLNTTDTLLSFVVGVLFMGAVFVVVFLLIAPYSELRKNEHSRKFFNKSSQWRHFKVELNSFAKQKNAPKDLKRQGLFTLVALGVLINAYGVSVVFEANIFAEALFHNSELDLKFFVNSRWDPQTVFYSVTKSGSDVAGGSFYLLGNPIKQLDSR